jgi:ABC-type Fe3+-hydroxamate transport system substrate-binding protein
MKSVLLFIIFLNAAFAAPPTKIVALTPSLAEWTSEILGQDKTLDRLIAVTEYSNYPEYVSKVKTIGPYPKINIELVLKLKPDLVLAIEGLNSEDQLKQLERLNLKVIRFPQERFFILSEWIRSLGKELGESTAANRIADEWQNRLEQLKLKKKNKLKVFVQIQDEPLVTVGSDSFLNDAFISIGYHNVFSDLKSGYPKVSRESVIERNPDKILILDLTGKNNEFEGFKKKWRQFISIEAVRRNQVTVISGDDFARCSFRLLRAIQDL